MASETATVMVSGEPQDSDARGVVIGGGGAIGRAIVRKQAGLGARIMVADVDEQAARETVRLVGDHGDRVWSALCDVRDPASLDAVAGEALEWAGGLDFVVLAFGISQSGGILEDNPAGWPRLLETNVLGTAYAVRAFAPALTRSCGRLVVVASLSGREIYPEQPLYIASKWAVVGLTHSVRRELQKSGVRVSVVAPGLVDTPMSRSHPHGAALLRSVAPLAPEDIAEAVGFILRQPPNVLIRELQLQPVGQEI